MTRFARVVARVKKKWRYRSDGRKDTWTFGDVIRRWVEGVLRRFYVGDCEDYCFRVIQVMEGGKKKAVQAIKDGKYIIWWSSVRGTGIDHAVVECVKTGEFAEVIFGKAVKEPNKRLGTIRIIKKASAYEVLFRLGYIQTNYPSEK